MNNRCLLRSVIWMAAAAMLLVATTLMPTALAQTTKPADTNSAAKALAASSDNAGATPAAKSSTDAAAGDADADAGSGADQPKTAFELWVGRIKTTGTTGVFLFLLSILGLAFVLERLVRLKRDAVVPAGLSARADELWRKSQYDQITQACNERESTLGKVIAEVVRHRHMNSSEISTLAGDVASREMRRLQNKAYPISVVAGLAPLLGLMGTVVGMVGAFETVAAVGSMGDPSVLADDISKALLTTAWGLAIAIPALAMYHYFKTRTNQFGLMLEEQVSELLSDWFSSRRRDAQPAAATADADEPAVQEVH